MHQVAQWSAQVGEWYTLFDVLMKGISLSLSSQFTGCLIAICPTDNDRGMKQKASSEWPTASKKTSHDISYTTHSHISASISLIDFSASSFLSSTHCDGVSFSICKSFNCHCFEVKSLL